MSRQLLLYSSTRFFGRIGESSSFHSGNRTRWKMEVTIVGPVPTSEATRGNDSDTSISDNSNSTDTSDGDTTDDDDSTTPAGDRWEENSQFQPSCPLPLQQFQEHFTSSGRSRRQRTGLQCSPISVNTPIRAWREVFKNTLLDKIVHYTNNYGKVKAKRW